MSTLELIQCRADYNAWLCAMYGPNSKAIDLWHVYQAAWVKGKSYNSTVDVSQTNNKENK